MNTKEQNLCCVSDFEFYAEHHLPQPVMDYYRSGACQQKTLQLNKEMFEKLRIRPRVLIDISNLDTSTTILGHKIRILFGIALTAIQKMAHPDGEIGNARAIGVLGGPFILSTLSTTSLKDVASGAPDTMKWFQLCMYKDRELTKSVVQWAEKAGYKALVLTVDASVFGSEGILTAEDAIKAADHGVPAILVSNHGGRQLDTVSATIESLPEIVKAVGNRIEVYLAGGIQFGTDIFKAFALGAKMVFIGRAVSWGLVYNGEKGVKTVLDILNEEFRIALALSGSQQISDIKKDMVVHESYYHNNQ